MDVLLVLIQLAGAATTGDGTRASRLTLVGLAKAKMVKAKKVRVKDFMVGDKCRLLRMTEGVGF